MARERIAFLESRLSNLDTLLAEARAEREQMEAHRRALQQQMNELSRARGRAEATIEHLEDPLGDL